MTPNHVTQMHNPPHPGEFIKGVDLEPCGLSIRQVAERLGGSALSSDIRNWSSGDTKTGPPSEAVAPAC